MESCAALPPEHLNASIPGSFGTLYETFEHIARAERGYFSRISTGQRYNAPPDEPPMTFDEIEQLLKTTGTGLIEWAARVQPDDIVMIDWEGTPREVAKTVLLTQVIQHASEHREQIKAIMTMLGIEPPDLQSWAYFDAGEPVLST